MHSIHAGPPAVPSSDQPRPPRVGVMGHFGDSNLGDEAIIEAFVTRLRREWPAVELRIFSMHPGDSRRRYRCESHSLRLATEFEQEFRPLIDFMESWHASGEGSAAGGVAPAAAEDGRPPRHPALARCVDWLDRVVPRGRLRSTAASVVRTVAGAARELAFLRRSFGRVRGLDVMFVTGSNQFLDNFGGPWGFPYTLLKWTLMCRLRGCRVAFVSVGAGPLDRRASHWMVARAIGLSDYVSFRDEGSRRLILEATGHDGVVLPDLAHSLHADPDPALAASSRGPEATGALRIAINAMPVHDPRYWHRPDPVKYERYVAALSTVCRGLASRGHDITFFATQFPDANVAVDVARATASAPVAPWPVAVPMTVQELLGVLRGADIVVATRFHGILLSLLMERPTVGICYYRKSRELLAEAGLAAYAFDIDDFDAAALEAAVVRIIEERRAVVGTVASRSAAYREALERQYVQLFDLVRRRLAAS